MKMIRVAFVWFLPFVVWTLSTVAPYQRKTQVLDSQELDSQDIESQSIEAKIDPSLSEGTVALVDGARLGSQDFKDWLYQRKGARYLGEYLEVYLLEREADKRGIEVNESAVELAFSKYWRKKAVYKYRTVEQYREHLELKGIQFDDYQAEQLEKFRGLFIAREVLRADQPVSDSQLREYLESRYGDSLERIHVRIAYFDKFRFPLSVRARKPGVEELKRHRMEALEKASAFRDVVVDGADFATHCREVSDELYCEKASDPIQNYAELGGEFLDFRRDALGIEVQSAIDGLSSQGELSRVIESPAGVYVIQLISKTPFTFADVEEDLRAEWHDRLPDAATRKNLVTDLWKRSEIVKRF